MWFKKNRKKPDSSRFSLKKHSRNDPLVTQSQANMHRFLDVVDVILNYQGGDPELKSTAAWASKYHSSGKFHAFLATGPRLSHDEIDRWFLDGSNGILHGMLLAFLAIFQKYDGKPVYHPDDEELIVSCLVHGFCECQNSMNMRFDKLETTFPRMKDMALGNLALPYHPNTMADLIRDLRSNKTTKQHKQNALLPNPGQARWQSSIEPFFQLVVPALKSVFEQRDEIWIRHSPEPDSIEENSNLEPDGIVGKMVDEDAQYYPWRFWAPYPEHWCIEVGMAPFGPNITRAMKFYRLLPIISVNTLRKYSNSPILTLRDHQCVAGKVPVSEWVCIYARDNLADFQDYDLLTKGRGLAELSLINRLLITTQTIRNLLMVLRAA